MYPIKTSLREFSLPKRLLLKGIAKLQKLVIKWDNTNLYYLLAKMHFRLWFGRSLGPLVVSDSGLAKLAARRHARLVLKVLYPTITDLGAKRYYAKSSMNSFLKNILIEQEL